MTFTIDGHDFEYETRNIVSIFFPGVKIDIARGQPAGEERWICSRLREEGGVYTASAQIGWDGAIAEKQERTRDASACEKLLCICLYKVLSELTGRTSQWGVLTGIRPVKLVEILRAKGLGDEAIIETLGRDYFVSENKAHLCVETAASETKITSLSTPRSFSLYISVPFCPSRCSYCSFVSHSIEKTGKLVAPYVKRLTEEIRKTGEIAQACALKLETIYIGGGTPTTLSAPQLKEVLNAVQESFDVSAAREFTCEAGRPDTIDEAKLNALIEGGVNRISINPQTMDDRVLAIIGRKHSADDIVKSFALARKEGFHNINMDVIAGLPGDSLRGFRTTVDTLCELDPENITIHTLSLKRAADMASHIDSFADTADREVSDMVDYGYHMLKSKGYRPYYMYRQKNTKGNLENVGYAKEGYEGLYNVFIMAEVHSILSVGAGGVTKLCDPESNRIERIFNYKYPYEYIDRFDEILRRKERVKEEQMRFMTPQLK